MQTKHLRTPAVLLALAAACSAWGLTDRNDENSVQSVQGSPIADVLSKMPEDVRTFDVHISTLASPYMQGRVPGSEGAERAKDYIEHYFREAGLTPAFEDEDGNGFASYRQPFPLSGTWTVERESMSASMGDKRIELEAENDFMLTGMGQNGTVSGEAVFVGYGMDDGPEGYNNFDGLDSLEGKIAVLFRFEPMDEDGNSKWNEGRRGWSGRAGFRNKIGNVAERNPAGIVIINPPGASDNRAERLARFQGAAQASVCLLYTSVRCFQQNVGHRFWGTPSVVRHRQND